MLKNECHAFDPYIVHIFKNELRRVRLGCSNPESINHFTTAEQWIDIPSTLLGNSEELQNK